MDTDVCTCVLGVCVLACVSWRVCVFGGTRSPAPVNRSRVQLRDLAPTRTRGHKLANNYLAESLGGPRPPVGSPASFLEFLRTLNIKKAAFHDSPLVEGCQAGGGDGRGEVPEALPSRKRLYGQKRAPPGPRLAPAWPGGRNEETHAGCSEAIPEPSNLFGPAVGAEIPVPYSAKNAQSSEKLFSALCRSRCSRQKMRNLFIL